MGLHYAMNFWILAVVFLPGALGSKWGVEYSGNPLCAIRGSTVVIPCSYKYEDSFEVETVMWCHDDEYCDKKAYVSHSSNTNISDAFRERAEYLGNKEKNCTLQIKNITDKDAGLYTFKFMNKNNTVRWSGRPGTTLMVDDDAWTVHYTERNLCAARGSTVFIQCEYEYPEPYKVNSSMWSRNDVDCTGKPYVYHSNNADISAEYTGRAELLGNSVRNCTLQIKNIRKTDAGEYRFRFVTNRCEKCGGPGVTLQVDELKVVMTSSRVNGTIREGDSVKLTCDTDSCSLSQSEFTWFKDNQTLPETQSTLHFSPISYHHTGKYSCALNGKKVTVSDKVNIIVESHFNTIIIITAVGILLFVLIGAIVIIIFMKRGDLLNVDKIKEVTKKREDKDLCSDSENQPDSAVYANCTDSSKGKSRNSNRYSEESCELPDYENVNIQESIYGNINNELTEYGNVNIK
ncbi:sialoadhesin-like isoform X9 [Brienomyrus brachyistius]|uniref:sialoadhesin-like isoform X9 n=1 Tax=Brienomyrus brachyistius TaxID=42636 RepID=UPI0020B32208|nr:sialoadhesin-like isoform X9 [Brienomyrus brachyistius]